MRESNPAIAQERAIPAWLKVFMFVATLGDFLLVSRAFGSSASQLFGISVSLIISLGLPLLILLLLTTVWFLFLPESAFSLISYWILRFLREQIIVVALWGMLYLLVIRVSIASLRGGFIWIALIGLFVIGLLLKPASIPEMPYYERLQDRNSLQRFLTAFRRVPTWVIQVMISLLPVGLILFIIYFGFGSRLSHYGPYSLFNDEVSYWIWLRSYHDVGFHSGYNAPNELLPFFEFSRYGEQSPIYLYIYGFLTKWINWFSALPVLVNFLILPVSIFLCLRVLKLTVGQSMLAGFAIILTWPVLFYLPMTTHETLNQVIGILLGMMIATLLVGREELRPLHRVAIVLFVYIATLIRVSWGLLLVPVLFYALNGKLAWRVILALVLGGGLFMSAVVLMSYFSPPINDTISQSFHDSRQNGLGIFIGKIYEQFFLLLKPRQMTPSLGVMFQMAVAAGWGIAKLAHSKKADLYSTLHSFAAFDVYNMLSLGVAGLTFYVYKNFFRAFAPTMLLMYLLLVKGKNYKRLAALLTVNILLFPAYLTYLSEGSNYGLVQADYTSIIPQRSTIQEEIEKFIAYDPRANNPWCNTLLIPLHFYDSRLMMIPSGIGISYLIEGPFRPPIKSAYALFDPPTYEMHKDATHLKLLTSLPIGDLYLNQDADCP